MKQKKADELRAAWADKPCEHPSFAKQYDAEGKRTGNYFCSQCGAGITFRERAELLATRPRTTEAETPES